MISKHLLLAANFSRTFVKSVPKEWRNTTGYMMAVDDPNTLLLITKDFTDHGQSLLATNMPLAFLLAESEESEKAFDDLTLQDLRTKMIGPGFHRHKAHCDIALCCESVETATSSGIGKFVNRFALLSTSSIQVLNLYLEKLEKIHVKEESVKRYVTTDENTWSRDMMPVRKSDTVFLGPLWTDILNDLSEFLSDECRQFHLKHGIPYIRTYLFYGHPGNGKSTCIKALASELKLNLYSLNLASARLDDSGLTDMIHSVLKRSIVAIEDVDRVFSNHSDNQTSSSVSFSTLLNVLDGILSKDGLVFILTCNHKDQLDEAFRRCGRIHSEFEFKDASKKVIDQMVRSFRPDEKEHKKVSDTVIRHLPLPVAAVQEFLVKNRKRKPDQLDDSMLTSRRRDSSHMVS